MFNKKYILISVVFFSLLFVAPVGVAFAKTVLYNAPPKDSDLDGLTDQGEIQIFRTDPNNADTDNDGYLDSAEVLSGTNPLKKELSVNNRNSYPQKISSSTPWSWYIMRSSGLTAYILLFLLIVSGIGIKTSLSYELFSPEKAWNIHKMLGITLSVAIATHLISILFDGFLQFSLASILIPFFTNFKSIYTGLGIIGFYLFLSIIITSLFYFKKMPKTWRLIHYLTYPTFILLFLHGIYTGTDTSASLVQLMYWVTGLIVLLLTSYRMSLKIIK